MKHTDALGSYRAHHKPKRSPLEAQNQSISAQDRATQTADYGAAQGTNAQFEGPVQNSPYYKALVASGTDATSNAYKDAEANTAARAREAGFGYDTPIGQAASRETQGAEAAAEAQIPAQAMEKAAPLSLQASQDTAAMGTAAGQQGEEYQQQATGEENQYQQAMNAFKGKLLNAGVSAATSFIPH